MLWKTTVEELLSQKFGKIVQMQSASSVGGGSINDAYRIVTSIGEFFVKKNSASRYPGMFEKEARGLELLANTNEIDTPKVVTFGSKFNESFLILNFIQSAEMQDEFWDDFGQKLASLHRHSQKNFGLD
ncbi:MAG: ketosamine-3-kinase, partial [Bacteroidetes bacterium]